MPRSSPCHRLSHLFRSPLFCRSSVSGCASSGVPLMWPSAPIASTFASYSSGLERNQAVSMPAAARFCSREESLLRVGSSQKLCQGTSHVLAFPDRRGAMRCRVGCRHPHRGSLALASLPRYLQPEDVERLIASCDRASAVGRRDRTILLLLARRTWPGARSGSQSDTRRKL